MSQIQLRSVGPDEITLLHDLVRQTETADGLPIATSRPEVEEWFSGVDADPELDVRIAWLDGQPVGWGHVSHSPSGEVLERAYLFGGVVSTARRRGVGDAVLRWSIDRATELVSRYEHDLPRVIRVELYDWLDGAHALCRTQGLTPVRWFDEMLRPLDDLPAAIAPGDVRIVPWDPDHGEAARRVRNESFADHWGTSTITPAAWEEWMTAHGTRLDVSVMAFAGDELVGISLNDHYPDDEEVTGRRDGWIQSIGVLRSWRGRGVASALIAASLQAFADAGFTHAMLGVDTDSPSAAPRLYRRLGFETVHRSVTFEREVTPSSPSGVTSSPR